MANSGPQSMSVAGVRLEPIHDENREGLRAAAAEDRDIWDIYTNSLLGDGFDRWWSERSADDSDWRMFTIHAGDTGSAGDRVVGMTGYALDQRNPGVVEVGSTYYVPRLRGSGLNRVVKWLMLSHLFGLGLHRVEFRIDARNARSRAAVLKLGAVEEGVLRHHKITHTGFIRDTHVYGITRADWARIEPGLRPEALSPAAPAGGGSSS